MITPTLMTQFVLFQFVFAPTLSVPIQRLSPPPVPIQMEAVPADPKTLPDVIIASPLLNKLIEEGEVLKDVQD